MFGLEKLAQEIVDQIKEIGEKEDKIIELLEKIYYHS